MVEHLINRYGGVIGLVLLLAFGVLYAVVERALPRTPDNSQGMLPPDEADAAYWRYR